MPGSQPGVLGLFTTPAKLLIYDNIITTFCQSVLRDLGKKKKSCFARYLVHKIFLFKLEFNDFVVDDDCDEVNDPPEPAEEDSDENPNNHHCPVLSVDRFDNTVNHPSEV